MTENPPKPIVETPKVEPKAIEPTPKPNPTSPQIDDPLVIEFANSLKEQLGDLYEKEYDDLPVKERIATMKIIKKTMDKMPIRSEGKSPEAAKPGNVIEKVKNHVERFEAGENKVGAVKSSAFGFTMNKNK